ncbi:hypothetical protein RRSWK_00999 [Rhodopirellula sp. SWK7]|nr:hypothetical protein RRSWK_00999 [Rhodopirellula sp. SWK7]
MNTKDELTGVLFSAKITLLSVFSTRHDFLKKSKVFFRRRVSTQPRHRMGIQGGVLGSLLYRKRA